ncbi:SAM-dependent methyltransferase [Streptomyces sp. F-3]|uniref:Class I SAM-dependent methyltransferase n=1 Tax=Streptomyces thermogriseus TaxID=75292 RepID=A0ABN1SYS8_9ACTN|nr:SAM-dependent methyltransferase [Streptomyces sp. F-3]
MSERTAAGGDGPDRERADRDARAAALDDEPDHGLRDPRMRAAWAERLRDRLPGPPPDVLDLGCGTGSPSLLAAEQGHRVTGAGPSPARAERARVKLAGLDAMCLVGDTADPPAGEQRFDAVLARHVLWTPPDPARALRRWTELLRPEGRTVLVEGVWGTVTPIGIPPKRPTMLLRPLVSRLHPQHL